jgi:STE24 endopeptidase
MIWNAYSLFVFGLMTLMFVINLTMALLNYGYRHQPLPNNVKDIYPLKKYKDAKAYFTENTIFGLIRSTFQFIVFFVLLVTGFFPFFVSWLESITTVPLIQTFLFVTLLIIGNTGLSIPFSYYRTFSIETRFGFNKMTKKLFWTDVGRNIFLSSVLLSGIAVLLQWLYQSLGSNFILGAWMTLSILMIVLFMLNTKVFIKIFNKLIPLPEGSLKAKITDLAKKTGFKAKAIYSMDASKRSSKLNAFFSGFGPIREIALFDTLITKLSEEQILAVLAHEIGHAKHFDEIRLIMQQIIIFAVYAFVIQFVVANQDLALAFGFSAPFFAFGLILFSVLIEPLDFMLGLPLNYLSRKAEFAADAFAASQGYKQAMLEALKVLVNENFSNLTPHPLQVWLTYSHPPMSVRLAAIEKLPY